MPAPFQADALEPLPGYLVGVWIAGELQRKHDVLQCGQRRQELKRLEHETEQTLPQRGARILVETAERRAGETHVTPRGPVEPGKQAEQRRLARSGRADDGDCLSRGDIEADVVQDCQRLLAALYHFGKRVGANDRLGFHRWSGRGFRNWR